MSAKVAGHASVQDVREVFDALSDESMRMNSRRLLVDLRRVDEKFDMADHLIVSAAAATNLAHLEKVATLVAMGRKKGTTEEAARQRGVVLRTFTSETEAVSWLEAW
ncbi:MAG: STAS/SEC14 domain-containing protein [Ramlibacter sp.]|nr:STAS/SEC14 domain-containing protein [Ramlibacter sp.]